MKITKNYLKQIIKEEMNNLKEAVPPPPPPAAAPTSLSTIRAQVQRMALIIANVAKETMNIPLVSGTLTQISRDLMAKAKSYNPETDSSGGANSGIFMASKQLKDLLGNTSPGYQIPNDVKKRIEGVRNEIDKVGNSFQKAIRPSAMPGNQAKPSNGIPPPPPRGTLPPPPPKAQK